MNEWFHYRRDEGGCISITCTSSSTRETAITSKRRDINRSCTEDGNMNAEILRDNEERYGRREEKEGVRDEQIVVHHPAHSSGHINKESHRTLEELC